MCKDCSFWAWTVEHDTQGTYCATHWWAVFLIILAILLGILLCLGLCYFAYMAYKKSKLKGKAKGGNIDRYDDENRVGTSNDLGGYGGGYNYENKAKNQFVRNQAKDVQSYPGRNNNNSYGNYGNELSRSYGNDLGRSYEKNAFDYGGKSNLGRDAGNYMGGGYNPYGGY